MTEWQDIKTAPKDGTPILACAAGMKYPWIVRWSKMTRVPDRWESAGLGAIPFTAAYWQVLPEPPQ